MASIKLSELQSLSSISVDDLLFISDLDTGTSKKASFADLQASLAVQNFGDFDANQELELQAGLATGILYVKDLQIGA